MCLVLIGARVNVDHDGVCKYYIGPIGDLSLLTATAALPPPARAQFALSH